MRVVLLTNDTANRLKARADGLVALTMAEYVRRVLSGPHPELLDLLAEAASEAEKADLAKQKRSGYLTCCLS